MFLRFRIVKWNQPYWRIKFAKCTINDGRQPKSSEKDRQTENKMQKAEERQMVGKTAFIEIFAEWKHRWSEKNSWKGRKNWTKVRQIDELTRKTNKNREVKSTARIIKTRRNNDNDNDDDDGACNERNLRWWRLRQFKRLNWQTSSSLVLSLILKSTWFQVV